MTTRELITELNTYGYDLYLDGENLRYKFHALVEPPKERVAVLLDSLRRNKPEVISYLRSNERPNKPLSFNEIGLDIQREEAIYCSWVKKDVPRRECFKPLSCFHRDENGKGKECKHLKAFIRQRHDIQVGE